MTTSTPIAATRAIRRWRRWLVVLAMAGAAGLVVRAAAPWLVATAIHRELAARGFPGARFEVASVGLDHLRLTHVWLGPGLDLGNVELDAGIALLWRDPENAIVRHARIVPSELSRRQRPGGGGPRAIIPRIRIEDCVFLGANDIALDGTIARHAGSSFEIDLHASAVAWDLGAVTARAPRVHAYGVGAPEAFAIEWATHGDNWTASGRGRIDWASGVVALRCSGSSVNSAAGTTRSAARNRSRRTAVACFEYSAKFSAPSSARETPSG